MSPLEFLLRRYYTKELDGNPSKSVYDLFQWKKVDVVLKDYKSGKILTDFFPST